MASNRLSKGFVDYYQVHNRSPSGGARERKEGEPVDGTRLPIERIPPTSIFMPPAPPGVSSRGQLTPHGGAPAEFGDTDSDTETHVGLPDGTREITFRMNDLAGQLKSPSSKGHSSIGKSAADIQGNISKRADEIMQEFKDNDALFRLEQKSIPKEPERKGSGMYAGAGMMQGEVEFPGIDGHRAHYLILPEEMEETEAAQ